MRVKCINNVEEYYTLCLTKGEVYEVLEERSNSYIIKNDNNILGAYRKSNFEKVDEKEKVLEIEFQDVFDKVAWRIAYQNEDVLKRGEFKDKDIEVRSTGLPIFSGDTLYILGFDRDCDKSVQIISKEEAEIIKQKVDAINEKYGIPKRWRAKKGERYFFISGNYFDIFETTDNREIFDKEQYELCNYFKTKEEAQAKLDKIKQIFAE